MRLQSQNNKPVENKEAPKGAYLSFIKKVISKRIFLFFILTAVLSSSVASIISPQLNAINKTSSMSTIDMAKSYAGYRWLKSCMQRNVYQGNFVNDKHIPEIDVNNFNWFRGKMNGIDLNVSTAGVILDNGDSKDGDVSCGEGEGDSLIGSLVALWGYSGGSELLCDLGFTRDTGSAAACTNVTNANNNSFLPPSDPGKAIDDWYKNKIGNDSTGLDSIAQGGTYSLYLQSFIAKCGTPAADGEYSIQTFTSGSAAPQTTRYTSTDRNYTKTSGDVRIYQDKSLKCGELEDLLRNPDSEAVLGYVLYLKAHNNTDAGQGTPRCAPGSQDPECVTSTSKTSCSVEGLGWIICPAVSLLAKATDALWGWIKNALEVQPLNLNTSSDTNTMYIAWRSMRDIANVAFIIAFIIIVYSQLTGVGVSNYGIKKLLPRLVVAAILVNTSFWIAAIAVDVSNIIGNNIYQLLRNGLGVGTIQISASIWDEFALFVLSAGGAAGLTAGISALVGAGSAGAAAFAPVLLWGFVVVILAVALALLIAFIILAVRLALITILVVLSPLAFVAMLLPNTEKFFTLWRKSLTTLLIFYPLFAVLFGGSYLAGIIIIGSADGNSTDPNNPVLMTVLIGLAVMILPLWLTPLVMRFSTGILGQVAGVINSKNKGLIDRARKVRDRKSGLAVNEVLGRPGSKNPFSRIYRRVQSSARGDADRQKIVDNTNQATYARSTKGVGLSYQTKLASEKAELADATNTAEYEELKATSIPITADNPYAQMIKQVRDTNEKLEVIKSRTDSAKKVLHQEYAAELSSNPSAARAAGGIDPRGASRVVAGAQYTLQKAISDEIDAERSLVSSITDINTLTTQYAANGTSPARRAALAERMISIGDPGGPNGYEKIVNSIGGNSSQAAEDVMLRQTVAKALSQNGPKALKASDIDAIATGTLTTRTQGAHTFADTIADNVKNGVYSQEKIVEETNANLKYAFAAADIKGQQLMVDQAAALKANPTLSGRIKHNRAAIDNLSMAKAP